MYKVTIKQTKQDWEVFFNNKKIMGLYTSQKEAYYKATQALFSYGWEIVENYQPNDYSYFFVKG